MAAGDIPVYGVLKSGTVDGVLAETNEIKDPVKNQFQSQINQAVQQMLDYLASQIGGGGGSGDVTIPGKKGPSGIPFDGQRCMTKSPDTLTYGDYIGMNGVWVPTSINFYQNDGHLHLFRLESFDLEVENCFRVFGGGFAGLMYPPHYVGAFYELRSNPSDKFENYKNGSIHGDSAAFGEEHNGFKGLHCKNIGDYFDSKGFGEDCFTYEGLVKNGECFTLGAWFYLDDITAPRYIFGGGAATAGLSVYVDTDQKVYAKYTLNDHTFRTLCVSGVTIGVNEWHRVVLVWDSDNVLGQANPSVSLFVDSMSNRAVFLCENQESWPAAPTNSKLVAGAGFKVVTSSVETDAFNITRPDIYSQSLPVGGYSVVTYNNGGNNNGAFCRTLAHTTLGDGKVYYWESIVPDLSSNPSVGAGFIDGQTSQAGGLGTNGLYVNFLSGQVINRGVRIYYTGEGPFTEGDVIGFEVSSEGKVKIYKNGVALSIDWDSLEAFDTNLYAAVLANEAAVSVGFNFTTFENAPAGVNPLPVGGSSEQSAFDFQAPGHIHVRRFYCGNEVDVPSIKILLATAYFQAIFENVDTKERIVLSDVYAAPPKKDDEMSITVPYSNILPVGTYDLILATAQGETNALRCNVLMPEHVVEPIDLDFSVEDHLLDYFYSTHKAWGGSSGGCVTENILWEPGKVTFVANGDLYTGSTQGVNNDGTPKWHTIEGDPDYGKPWTTRVGACIQTKKAMGFGRYEVNFKLVGENGNPFQVGVCAAIWTFFYDEEYTTSPFYPEIVDEGIISQGSEEDGFYVVRNHEIDIELPSHLDGGIRHQPSWNNMKCNSWIGELGSGDGTEGPGEEYISRLTPIGFYVNDGEYHNFRFDWYPDRIEFYVDDVLKQTVTKFIPDIPGHMTIGLWFPSAPCPGAPWWVKNGWAGGVDVTDPTTGIVHQIANWGTQTMVMNRFKFTPFTEYENLNRDKGESFPFGTVRNLVGQIGSKHSFGPGPATGGRPVVAPSVQVQYAYKFVLTNVDNLNVDGVDVQIPQDNIVYMVTNNPTAHFLATKLGYVPAEKTIAGVSSNWGQSQCPRTRITLEKDEHVSIEIAPEPSDALVIIDGEIKNVFTGLPGDSFSYNVSKRGFREVSGVYTIAEGEESHSETVTLEALTYNYKFVLQNVETLTINGEAHSIAEDGEYLYTLQDVEVEWVAEKTGFATQRGTAYGLESGTVTVEIMLGLTLTFAIDTDLTADVQINGVATRTATGTIGDTFNYQVSKSGYGTVTGSFTFVSNQDHTEVVVLQKVETLANDVARVINAIKAIDSTNKVVWTHMSDIHTQITKFNSATDESGNYASEGVNFTKDMMDTNGQQGYKHIRKATASEVEILNALMGQSNIRVLGAYCTGDIVERGGIPGNNTPGNMKHLSKELKYLHRDGYEEEYAGSTADFAFVPGNHDAGCWATEADQFPEGFFDTAQYSHDAAGTYTRGVAESRSRYEAIYNKSANTYKVFSDVGIIVALFDFYNKSGSLDASGKWNDMLAALQSEIQQHPDYKIIIFSHQSPSLTTSAAYTVDAFWDYLGLSSTNAPSIPMIGGSGDTRAVITNLSSNILSIHCGHKHADEISISQGFPVICADVAGLLVTNDETGRRRNYYDAATSGGYTSQPEELNTIAACSVNVFCYDKQHGVLYQYRVGIGPDVVYQDAGVSGGTLGVSNFGVAGAPASELSAALKSKSFIKIVASPFYVSPDMFSTAAAKNLVDTGGYKMCVTAALKEVGGVQYYKNPFIPKGWKYVIVGYNVSSGNVTDFVVDPVIRTVV